MGTLKWYKRDPARALLGMRKLTLEECGAYAMVLEMIYIDDGALIDDDRFIANTLQIDIRKWRRIRTQLLSLGKLYVNGEFLRNERADREIDAVQHRVRSAALAGLESARKRGYGIREINGMQPTTVQRALEQSTSRKKDLSATIVPIEKRTAEKERKL